MSTADPSIAASGTATPGTAIPRAAAPGTAASGTAASGTTRPVSLPGHRPPAAGLEAPFEMLAACHERVERMLALQARLQQHLLDTGCDESARQAARDVMRYFDIAAPLHHQDEELHVFPPLLAGSDTALRELAQRLIQDHRQMETAWVQARSVLQAIADSRPPVDSSPPTDSHPATDSSLAADSRPAAGWSALAPAQTEALNEFAALYRQHLDDENGVAYPAAEAVLPSEAVQAMSEDMMQRRGVVPVRAQAKER